ncbi:zinc finger c-x8-c-x5-c-x3-h type domain-containing protein [Cyclospora cayetanensis]|uniref:Zinc finger c-x8-c-x5-c-x3-h type domain-containing protein n=1 Tax=Cyclospora cayetanensis TaxID=88456 RepID=A0A1D3CUN2_9EIME|nr:zinc finger c-x8-c-x5-c-x3-h type domain-containing protein [Cyclospora cayetanensis]
MKGALAIAEAAAEAAATNAAQEGAAECGAAEAEALTNSGDRETTTVLTVESAAATPSEQQGLVEVQVGPRLFYATRKTLSKSPVLRRMIRGQEAKATRTPEGVGNNPTSGAPRLLLDCEPEVFSVVLSYLRTGEIDGSVLCGGRKPPGESCCGGVYEHTLRQEFRLLQLPWPRRCMRCVYLYNPQLYQQLPGGSGGSFLNEEAVINPEEMPACFIHPGRLQRATDTGPPIYTCCAREEGEIGCKAARHISTHDMGCPCEAGGGGAEEVNWQKHTQQQQQELSWLGRSCPVLPYGAHPVPAAAEPGGHQLYSCYPYAAAPCQTSPGDEDEQQQQQTPVPLPYAVAVPHQYLIDRSVPGYNAGGPPLPGAHPLCAEEFWACEYMRMQQQQQQQLLMYCPFVCPYTCGSWDPLLPQVAKTQGGGTPSGAPGGPPGASGALLCSAGEASAHLESPGYLTRGEGPTGEQEPVGATLVGTLARPQPSGNPRQQCRWKRCPREAEHPDGALPCAGARSGGPSVCHAGSGDIEDVRELPGIHPTLKEGSGGTPLSRRACCERRGGGARGALGPTSKSIVAAAVALQGGSRTGVRENPTEAPQEREDALATVGESSNANAGGPNTERQPQPQQQEQPGLQEEHLEELKRQSEEQQEEQREGDQQQKQQDMQQYELMQQHSCSKPRAQARVTGAQGPQGSQAPNPLFKTRMCQLYKNGLCRLASRRCKFAHALRELRSTSDFYKTGLCAFWAAGFCRAGTQCRHAHGEEEMRGKVECQAKASPGCDGSACCSASPPQEQEPSSCFPPASGVLPIPAQAQQPEVQQVEAESD